MVAVLTIGILIAIALTFRVLGTVHRTARAVESPKRLRVREDDLHGRE
jgi:hypothetical protein